MARDATAPSNVWMADDAAPRDLGVREPAKSERDGTAERDRRTGSLRSLTGPAVRRWISVLEHAQDIVAVTAGVVLVALAAILLVSGVVDFLDGADGSISAQRRSSWIMSCSSSS